MDQKFVVRKHRSTQRTSNPNGVECSKLLRLKSRYCAKATKLEEISQFFFEITQYRQNKVGDFFNFSFSEYLIFKRILHAARQCEQRRGKERRFSYMIYGVKKSFLDTCELCGTKCAQYVLYQNTFVQTTFILQQ